MTAVLTEHDIYVSIDYFNSAPPQARSGVKAKLAWFVYCEVFAQHIPSSSQIQVL